MPTADASRLVETAVLVLSPRAARARFVPADLRADEAHRLRWLQQALGVAEFLGEPPGLGEQHGLALPDGLGALLDEPRARASAHRQLVHLLAPALARL